MIKKLFCFLGIHGPTGQRKMIGISSSTIRKEEITVDVCNWCELIYFSFPF